MHFHKGKIKLLTKLKLMFCRSRITIDNYMCLEYKRLGEMLYVIKFDYIPIKFKFIDTRNKEKGDLSERTFTMEIKHDL